MPKPKIKHIILILSMMFLLNSCAVWNLPVDMNGPRAMTEQEAEEFVDGVIWDVIIIVPWFI